MKKTIKYEIEIKSVLKFDEKEIINALEYFEDRTSYETSEDILNDIIGYISNYCHNIDDIQLDDRFCLINELITTYKEYCSKHILKILENENN